MVKFLYFCLTVTSLKRFIVDHLNTVGLSFSVRLPNQEYIAQLCFIFAPSSSQPVDRFTSPRLMTLQHPKLLGLTDSITSDPASSDSLPWSRDSVPFLRDFWNDWYLFWTGEERLVNHRHPPWILALGIYPVGLTHCPDLHLWIYIILISICVFVCTCAEWLWNAAILVW